MQTQVSPPAEAPRSTPAADKILDVAEQLAQTRGFNGFSYADIAAKLNVTKASLHYHFRSKADLGRALIARYHVVFERALAVIAHGPGDARAKLLRYVELYYDVIVSDRMCLCGMLAAEYATLPVPMQAELRLFFDANERWLSARLDEGRRAGKLAFREPAKERARLLVGALEGAMLVARVYDDGTRFRAAALAAVADLHVRRASNGA
jgi:TetR/AcrR family transcriptional regulator, transcriptional repressor for nem operon